MKNLIIGEKVKVSDYISGGELEVIIGIDSSMTIDISCFGLDDKKQLSDDRYMIFYNQASSPEGAIQMIENTSTRARFKLNLNKIPSKIKNMVFTAAIDGSGVMSNIRSGYISICDNAGEKLRYNFEGSNFKNERAIIISEIYFKDLWRLTAVGRGFDGGLSALLKHFGGEEATDSTPSKTPPQSSPVNISPQAQKKISLEKKMEEKAPAILSLAKKATISLKKVGLEDHCAKVALCLDISGSMNALYNSGKIQAFAERILALGCRFDDDGSIDIFLFGKDAHDAGELSIDNFNGFVNRMRRQYPLEGATYYGKAMNLIRSFYNQNNKSKLPTYVMFVTDGATFDEDFTRKQLIDSSREPIFWQFMAIGKSQKGRGFFSSLTGSDFTFLEELDNLRGRYIDNANFFSVEDPSSISDEELYDLLMTEYPSWLKEARGKNLL